MRGRDISATKRRDDLRGVCGWEHGNLPSKRKNLPSSLFWILRVPGQVRSAKSHKSDVTVGRSYSRDAVCERITLQHDECFLSGRWINSLDDFAFGFAIGIARRT